MKKIYLLLLISSFGFYFTSAKNSAANGCTTTASAGPDTTICSGNLVQFFASGGNQFPSSPGIFLTDSTIADPIAFPPSSMTYTVTVTDSSCTPATATVTINVLPSPPTPTIFLSNDTLFCSFDSSYVSYQWYDTSSIIPGATKTFFVTDTCCSNINVLVTDRNGCSIAVGINGGCCPGCLREAGICGASGILNYITNNIITLFPNPATNQLTIHASSLHSDKPATVFITNVLGQNASPPAPLQSSGEDAVIDVSGLAAGFYFVRVSDDKQSWAGRFVKE